MKYKLTYLFLAFVLLVSAQNEEGSGTKNVQKYKTASASKKKRIAKQKIKEGSFYNAAQYLEDVHKAKPNDIKTTYQLAELNRMLRDYRAAERYYKLVMDADPGKFVNAGFYLAQMMKMNGKYEDAKKAFQDFLKVKDDDVDSRLKSLARVEMVGCDSALTILNAPSKIKVSRNEAMSTQIQDLAPKPLKGGRALAAHQKTDTAVNLNVTTADHYTSLYTYKQNGDKWGEKTLLPSPPNDKATHIGNGIYNADETMLIYTKCDQSLIDTMKCKLWWMKKENSVWGEPAELKELNKGNTTTQPAWGLDNSGNQILYFVSDRSGKSMDIFYATYNKDGTWGAVESAGPEVNTQGDEYSPCYDTKMKGLYFSSNGHPSIGGLDVFRISGAPGAWGAVVNMGVPTNSSADDFYFAVDEKGRKGFMVSNRVGSLSNRGETCCDDIYNVVLQGDVVLKGVYVKRGDASNTPLVGVDAAFYKVNGSNFDFVANAKTTNAPFVFPLERGKSFKLNGSKDGFWPAVDNISVNEDEDRDTIFQIFYMDPIIKKKLKIENVYFAFDKSNVLDFYKVKIDSVVAVLNANPGYSVEVQGHTDSKGSDDYNIKLSERRAGEVKKYLVKTAKIAENRIVVKTFGESQPALPNETPDGQDDAEARARNRRVEFRLIPDKPDDAPEFEYVPSEVIEGVKTGPGFTTKKK